MSQLNLISLNHATQAVDFRFSAQIGQCHHPTWQASLSIYTDIHEHTL